MVFPPTSWRLIQTPPASGAWNMAVDEALLEGMAQPQAMPVLRLYAWEPPCLSLGYAQPIADVDQERLGQLGWDLVRRPTGGRAILHTDELTYAVIGPQHEPRLEGSVLESYQRLSTALLAALRQLHVPAHSQGEASRSSSKGPVCFEVPSNYEITVEGKKLIGSAQARRKEGVLQHGSLPLYGDLTRITQVLVFSDKRADETENKRQRAADRLLQRATTLGAALGYEIQWETAAQAFIQAFREVLNLDLQPSQLSHSERKRAEALAISKYADPVWTGQV